MISRIREWFSPPQDLYSPLIVIDIDLSDRSNFQFSYEHRHKGPHALGLEVEYKVPLGVSRYDWGGRFKVTCTAREGRQLQRDCGQSPSPWWGDRKSGFYLIYFSVPQDLPVAEPIECIFEVLECGTWNTDQYGDAALFVQRISDK